MKKLLQILFVLSMPALLIIIVIRVKSQHKQNLPPILERIESATADINRLGRKLIELTDQEEMEVGLELSLHLKDRYTILDKKDLKTIYVSDIGKYLCEFARRKLPFYFYVIQSDKINAYALPGGHIYVTSGLLSFIDSEAQLASVLGHEIAHVDLFHCADKVRYWWTVQKKSPKHAQLVLILTDILERGYSEQNELEADRYGLLLAAQAQYHPEPLIDLMLRISDKEEPARDNSPARKSHRKIPKMLHEALERYVATHPPAEKRAEVLKEEVEKNRQWKSQKFYIGYKNLKELKTRKEADYHSEWQILK